VIQVILDFLRELADFFKANFDPWRDSVDILLVTAGIYWLLLLIRGTRAVQILVGLIVLIALSLASELFQFVTTKLILENFLQSAVLIIIVLFQHDIRRALARVGRGFFPSVSAQQESQLLEELVRAAQSLADQRVGALMVIERESSLADQIDAGTPVNADLSKDLLESLFNTTSPLHDGAVVIRDGRIASAGCILPLTLRNDLPDGVGTRHRAAVGITEETDAVVIVVSEETSKIAVVMGGEMIHGLEAPQLRRVLYDIMAGDRRDLVADGEAGSDAGVGTEVDGAESPVERTAG
jgi:uncharacterized protein (TIGR00159 family)